MLGVFGIPAFFFNPSKIGNVPQGDKSFPPDSELSSLFEILVGKADPSLVCLHKAAEIAGELVAGFPPDGEVSDFPPILIMPKAPVANHLRIERTADAGEKRSK